jgi:hypothetical protein
MVHTTVVPPPLGFGTPDGLNETAGVFNDRGNYYVWAGVICHLYACESGTLAFIWAGGVFMDGTAGV